MGKKICTKPGRTKGGLKKRNWARTCTGEGAVKGESFLYSGSPPLAGRSAGTRGALEEGAARGVEGRAQRDHQALPARDAPCGAGQARRLGSRGPIQEARGW